MTVLTGPEREARTDERVGANIAQPSPTCLPEHPPQPRHAVVELLRVQAAPAKINLVPRHQVALLTNLRRAPLIIMMSFLRSKGTQVAEHLRDCILQNQLIEPLPSTRLWSQELGVCRRTLHMALKKLEHEGLLEVQPRRIRLIRRRSTSKTQIASPCSVRVLLYQAYPAAQCHAILMALQERLWAHRIELKFERCGPSRLREISRQPMANNEMLILFSIPVAYQKMFAASPKPTLVLGAVAPDISLPFVNTDLPGTVRHATFKLLREGFSQVNLIYGKVGGPGIEAAGTEPAIKSFRRAASEWSKQPVEANLIETALDQYSIAAMARRLAERFNGRHGFIVISPVPVGVVVTALLHHGISILAQTEVVAIFHPLETINLYPPPISYPMPIGRIVKFLTDACIYFSQMGYAPPIYKTVPVKLAEARPCYGRK